MTKRTQVNYYGISSNPADDALDEHVVKKTAAPHPDLFTKCSELIPHLLVCGDLKSGGQYKILEIDFNPTEDGESITVTAEKQLEGGKVLKVGFPALAVENQLVQIISDLYDEIEMFVDNSKLAQGELPFEEGDEEEEEGQQAEAA